MTSRIRIRLLAAACITVLSATAAQADCVAKVSPADSTTITDHGQVMINLSVDPAPCAHACHGVIAYRVHYLNTSGEAQVYELSTPWSSADGKPTRVSKLSYRDSCNNNSFGPCKLQSVEVVKVSCD